MSTHKEIEKIVAEDPAISPISLEFYDNNKDPYHVVRKQQQRAITNSMILIALHYGKRKYTFQDLSYTITDRSLVNTPYYKYVDKLRGLTVIGNNNPEAQKFIVVTAFWNFLVKSRKRY